MKLSRGSIVYGLALFAMFGAFGAVYQFYFKEKLAAYAADERYLKLLEDTFKGLETDFGGYKPDLLITAWRAEQQPWADAVDRRKRWFGFGDWLEVEGEPDEGQMWRFWYKEKVDERVFELYQKVAQTMGGYNFFPQDIRQNLELKTLEDWTTGDVGEREIMTELGRMEFGLRTCELLLDARASSISDVRMWPVREEQRFGKKLRFRTMGLAFTMPPRDFVAFSEKLRTEQDRFFSVDGLRIVNTCLLCQPEPHLTVEMIVSQANYIEPPGGAPGATASPGSPAGATAQEAMNQANMRRARAGRDEAPAEEPGFFGKLWKLFKRYVLYMN